MQFLGDGSIKKNATGTSSIHICLADWCRRPSLG